MRRAQSSFHSPENHLFWPLQSLTPKITNVLVQFLLLHTVTSLSKDAKEEAQTLQVMLSWTPGGREEGQGGQKAQLANLLSCKTLLSFPIPAAISSRQY